MGFKDYLTFVIFLVTKKLGIRRCHISAEIHFKIGTLFINLLRFKGHDFKFYRMVARQRVYIVCNFDTCQFD